MPVVTLGVVEVNNVRISWMTWKHKFFKKNFFFKILCLFHQKAIKCQPKKIFPFFFRSFGARNEITNNFAIKAHVGQSRFGSAFSFFIIELDRRFPLIMMFDKQKGIATPMNYSIWPSKLYRTIYIAIESGEGFW